MKKYTGKLYCFSPPVMLATFAIEIALALYALWRYKLNTLTRLVVAMLVLLAVFQLAEYMVCGGLGLSGVDWSRVGFVAITLLPPVGVHIVHHLAGRRNGWLVGGAYAASLAFVAYFAFALSAFEGNSCQGNYVIFELTPVAETLYGLYYYGFVLAGLVLAGYFARQAKKPPVRRALWAFAFGYTSFLLPTTTVNLIAPETISGIPSIMCGFAVVLALTVSIAVMPRVGALRRRKS